MKKDYYIVHVITDKENSYIPLICETIIKIDTQIFGQAYIFRDLITGRIINPFFDKSPNSIYSKDISTLTYNNINKKSYSKISRKKVLAFLKGINNEVIENYQNTLYNIEKNNTKTLTI